MKKENKENIIIIILTTLTGLIVLWWVLSVSYEKPKEDIQPKKVNIIEQPKEDMGAVISPILTLKETDLKDKILLDSVYKMKVGGLNDEWRVITPKLLEKLKTLSKMTDAEYLNLYYKKDVNFIVRDLDKRIK